jgi:hypothetical protein
MRWIDRCYCGHILARHTKVAGCCECPCPSFAIKYKLLILQINAPEGSTPIIRQMFQDECHPYTDEELIFGTTVFGQIPRPAGVFPCCAVHEARRLNAKERKEEWAHRYAGCSPADGKFRYKDAQVFAVDGSEVAL